MRVEISDVRDFVAEIVEDAERIHDKTVRIQIHRQPEQQEQISFAILMIATALVMTDKGSYLLEFGIECGTDKKKGNDNTGSKTADSITQQITEACKAAGLRVRAGRLTAGI